MEKGVRNCLLNLRFCEYKIQAEGSADMKEQKYIIQKETQNEKGDKIYLCYFLTKSESRCYGVGIDMYTQSASRRTQRERKSVNNIFASKNEAIHFIKIIAQGLVTPETLADIIEDKIFEKLEKNTCIS